MIIYFHTPVVLPSVALGPLGPAGKASTDDNKPMLPMCGAFISCCIACIHQLFSALPLRVPFLSLDSCFLRCSHLNKTTTYEDPRKDYQDEPPQPRQIDLIRDPEMGFGFVAGSEKPVIVR